VKNHLPEVFTDEVPELSIEPIPSGQDWANDRELELHEIDRAMPLILYLSGTESLFIEDLAPYIKDLTVPFPVSK
jgi:hypothetical protein